MNILLEKETLQQNDPGCDEVQEACLFFTNTDYESLAPWAIKLV